MKKMKRKTRTPLTRIKHHHPKAEMERAMLSVKEAGRSLLDVTELRNKQILNMRKHFQKKRYGSQLIAETKADVALSPSNLGQD